jgi:hypothetical protein
MFVIPFFATAWILVLGPGTIEKGIPAINEKGFKPAAEAAWEGRTHYDATSLKGTVGNYGND